MAELGSLFKMCCAKLLCLRHTLPLCILEVVSVGESFFEYVVSRVATPCEACGNIKEDHCHFWNVRVDPMLVSTIWKSGQRKMDVSLGKSARFETLQTAMKCTARSSAYSVLTRK